MSAKPHTDDTTRTTTETEFETALTAARAAATYDETPTSGVEFMFPECDMNLDTLGGTLVWFLSPSTQVSWTALREPDADEVDGAKPGDDAPRTARTFLFDAAPDDEDEADESDLVFRVVAKWTNSYDDERFTVEAPAPWDTPDGETSPNKVVKSLEWNDYHYAFDDDDRAAPSAASEAWSLDKSGAAPLKEAAEAAGYEWVVETDDEAEDEDERPADALDDLTAFADEDDEVRVRYLKKNGNGVGTKAGVLIYADDGKTENRFGRTGTQGLVFRRDDGKTTRVKRDDDDEPGVFSSGHYPYMGAVLSVEVTPADD